MSTFDPSRPPEGYPQQPQGAYPPQGSAPPMTAQQARANVKGAKAQAKAMRPLWKKKRFWLGLIVGLIVLISILSSLGNHPAGTTGAVPATTAPTKAAATTKAPPAETTAPETKAPATKAPATKAPETKAPAPEKTLSVEQENAIESAQSYLEMSSFSRKGLIHQLSSDAGEGYPKKVATFAVDYLNIDWNEQAAKSAKSYLEMSSFSRKGLIHQLSSDAGEGFTKAQAEYGVKKAGL